MGTIAGVRDGLVGSRPLLRPVGAVPEPYLIERIRKNIGVTVDAAKHHHLTMGGIVGHGVIEPRRGAV